MKIDIPAGTRVLVTGATGYTGQVLTRKLANAGIRVNAIARDSSDLSPLEDLDIEWFRGQVFDQEVVDAATQNVEYIFHVAAAFREAKSTEQDYRNIHLVSTQRLAEAALRQPDFKRFVLVSTMGVHGHIKNPPGDETTEYGPGDLYQSTKVEAEVWINQFAPENKLSYSIIRPCAIYGPGEKRLLKLFRMANKPVFPILGYGKCWYHMVHVEDLSNGIIKAATHPNAESEAFLIGSNEPIALEDMARLIAKLYNRKLRVIRMPIQPFFWLGDICEMVCKPFRIEPPIYRRRVAFYSKDRYFSTAKMRDTLEYDPIYDNTKGITESAHWYRDNGWI
ncbi:MAG: NAD(P)-dependent oxidoreductase [Pseudomonadota bacterium]